MKKHSKNYRILDIYARLCEGKYINKIEEAQKFGVDERSIQRDIDDIRAFLDNEKVKGKYSLCEIKYDRVQKGFFLMEEKKAEMSNSEILAISKIILESRAFTKAELDDILEKLIRGCVPLKNVKLVSDLIANEKYHYVELNHKSIIKDKLWDLGECVKENDLIQIEYEKGYNCDENITRIVEPVGIIFSEYYFYLNAYILQKDSKGDYIHKFDYPAIFRIDRINSYKLIGLKSSTPYSERFEEGEFRKRIQFMYAGKLMKIKFKYFNNTPEYILDRLPTAKIIDYNNKEYLFETEVYGKGIIMWLLSQGSSIEVISPPSIRKEIKEELLSTLSRYDND